ncbi:MAG: Spy/CpxP family protein refolding chaperone [Deltaproteobacteria bacterium]|nr:Spy/CpxP family protein refolding chaperone [Deltaproteobacteria bacterium]
MNQQQRSTGQFLITVTMLCSFFGAVAAADQIPDPDISQKEAIDHMHQQLHDDQAPFKAREAKALKELNEMTIREDVRIVDVNAKIDELLAAQASIMRLRYAHLVEMRAILTDEQKVGYDKGVLARSAVR